MPKKRITVRSKRPNPLFEEWLVEWRDHAIEKDSKLQYCYNKALSSLRKYPLPLETGRDCRALEGFGEKLCQMLDQRLAEYNKCTNALNPTTTVHVDMTQRNTTSCMPHSPQKMLNKTFTPKEYIPRIRSGSWAILITLYKKSLEPQYPGFMFKPDIIKEGRHLCDKSFIKPDPGSFYTAWSSMKTLLEKNLVIKRSSPAKFSLTDEGIHIACKLYKSNLNNEDVFCGNKNDFKLAQTINTNLATTNKKLNFKGQKEISFSPMQSSSSLTSEELIQDYPTEASPNLSQEETFICPPNTFEIILLVDNQEVKGGPRHPLDDVILAELTNLNITHELRNLKVGDYTWICRENHTNKELVLPYIVERKRMDDFGHSIKDGRFHEQKFRLKQSGIQNLVYLIEGYGDNTYTGLPLTTLLQAAVNTLLHDNFSVKFTDDTKATMKYLATFTHILKKLYQDKTLVSCPKSNLVEAVNDDELVSLMTFQEFNKGASKNKNFKVKDMFVRQLLQLKGVSVDKAIAIVEKYPTPRLLRLAYGNNNSLFNEKLLANLQYGKLKKKIGPILSKTIYQLFMNLAY